MLLGAGFVTQHGVAGEVVELNGGLEAHGGSHHVAELDLGGALGLDLAERGQGDGQRERRRPAAARRCDKRMLATKAGAMLQC